MQDGGCHVDHTQVPSVGQQIKGAVRTSTHGIPVCERSRQIPLDRVGRPSCNAPTWLEGSGRLGSGPPPRQVRRGGRRQRQLRLRTSSVPRSAVEPSVGVMRPLGGGAGCVDRAVRGHSPRIGDRAGRLDPTSRDPRSVSRWPIDGPDGETPPCSRRVRSTGSGPAISRRPARTSASQTVLSRVVQAHPVCGI